MPEHKMINIGGIRYRPADVPDGYTPPAPRTLSTRVDTPPANTGPFDPAAATVEQVLAHLAEADHAEAVRVLDAEAEGKDRSTVTGKRDEILAAKEDNGDGDSGGASS